jgi:hypothetical protein
MQMWVVNMLVLSLICHGCFIGAIILMMKAEAKKHLKSSQ